MENKNLKQNLDEGTRMSRRGFLKTAAAGAGAAGMAMIGASSFGSFLTSCTTKEHFDTIIANGVVYCGDGKAPLKNAMVGIKNGKIVNIWFQTIFIQRRQHAIFRIHYNNRHSYA